jgi:DNA-binding transcriptional MerR regulator
MDGQLADSKRSEDDKILTKTMINNYTKNNLLPPPQKKKYSKEHIYLLIYIYYLKNLLCINDIQSIINPLTDMFYNNKKAELNLEEIYKGIVNMETQHSKYVTKDILMRYKDSKKAFANVSDPEQREFLENFAYVSELSYDVYMKTSLIEKLIDGIFSKIPKDNKKEDEDK